MGGDDVGVATSNPLFDEMKAYEHITIAYALQKPSVDLLRVLDSVHTEHIHGDGTFSCLVSPNESSLRLFFSPFFFVLSTPGFWRTIQWSSHGICIYLKLNKYFWITLYISLCGNELECLWKCVFVFACSYWWSCRCSSNSQGSFTSFTLSTTYCMYIGWRSVY